MNESDRLFFGTAATALVILVLAPMLPLPRPIQYAIPWAALCALWTVCLVLVYRAQKRAQRPKRDKEAP